MKIHSYRKKPVNILAIQYTGENGDEVREFVRLTGENPEEIVIGDLEGSEEELYIETLEGVFHVSPDDYIICGIENEFYPCKPSIFEQTYEKIK